MHVKGRLWRNVKIVKCVKISGILQLIDRTIQTFTAKKWYYINTTLMLKFFDVHLCVFTCNCFNYLVIPVLK